MRIGVRGGSSVTASSTGFELSWPRWPPLSQSRKAMLLIVGPAPAATAAAAGTPAAAANARSRTARPPRHRRAGRAFLPGRAVMPDMIAASAEDQLIVTRKRTVRVLPAAMSERVAVTTP